MVRDRSLYAEQGYYRGQPNDLSLTLAVAFAGHMMIELIEQHDDKPSVYQETIKIKGTAFIIGPSARSRSIGTSRATRPPLSDRLLPIFRARCRIVYMDATRDLPECSRSSRPRTP